jgi:hypothetical protein
VDEPRPGRLARLAVRPYWPLLAAMAAGGWLAWPWFAFNAQALGAPARRRTYAWIAGVVVVTVGLVLGIDFAEVHGWIPESAIPWAVLPIVLWKLATVYALFEQQEITSELFLHFGGKLRSGAILTVAGVYVGHTWIAHWAARVDQSSPLVVGMLWVLQ